MSRYFDENSESAAATYEVARTGGHYFQLSVPTVHKTHEYISDLISTQVVKTSESILYTLWQVHDGRWIYFGAKSADPGANCTLVWTHLYSGFRQRHSAGELLPDEGVRVVRPLENSLQGGQLLSREGRTTSPRPSTAPCTGRTTSTWVFVALCKHTFQIFF